MTQEATNTLALSKFLNRVAHGDCIDVMKEMPSKSVDFILTDPPYLVSYVDRSGRSVKNDDNDRWMLPLCKALMTSISVMRRLNNSSSISASLARAWRR